MSAFDFFSGLLHSSVGNNMDNDPEDIRKTKSNLKNAGYFNVHNEKIDNPIFTRTMNEGIKAFQKDKGLKVDGIIKPFGETERELFETLTYRKAEDVFSTSASRAGSIGFGGNISGTLRVYPKNNFPAPERKPIFTAQQRKEVILQDKDVEFNKILANSDANGNRPIYALNFYSEVQANKQIIEREAKKAGVSSDMVKAIIYLETTQGYYDRLLSPFGLNHTIRPMNIHATYWKELGFSRKDLNDPEKNIQAGIKLLKNIEDRMPNASAAEIATVYNHLGAKKVSDYGARIERLLKDKPWEK